jgi:hypothetical protein
MFVRVEFWILHTENPSFLSGGAPHKCKVIHRNPTINTNFTPIIIYVIIFSNKRQFLLGSFQLICNFEQMVTWDFPITYMNAINTFLKDTFFMKAST